MKKKSVEMQPAHDRREGGNHFVPKRNNPALASCESVAVKRIFRGMNGPEPPKVDDHFVHSMNNMVPKKCENAAMNGFKQQAARRPGGFLDEDKYPPWQRIARRKCPPGTPSPGRFAKIPVANLVRETRRMVAKI